VIYAAGDGFYINKTDAGAHAATCNIENSGCDDAFTMVLKKTPVETGVGVLALSTVGGVFCPTIISAIAPAIVAR
jgi:hypothetical protein